MGAVMQKSLATIVSLSAMLLTGVAEARITRVEIQKTEPAFGGRSFDPVGACERLAWRGHVCADAIVGITDSGAS